MRAEPYLFFHGRCAEACDFYRDVLGAKIEALIRFGDMPGSPDHSQKVMHATLRIGETVILASDGNASSDAVFSGFALSLQVATEAEAERLFAVLGADGKIELPLMSTPFATRFGKLADRFGTPWMVVTQPQKAG